MDVEQLVLRRLRHRGPRGAGGGNSGSGDLWHPASLFRLPAPGVRGGETRSAGEEPRSRFVAMVKFSPRLGFRWAWTAEGGGRLARSELRACRPPPPPRASLLLGARGAVRAPEQRQAARAPARAPLPAASPPGLPKSPPVGASVASASAGATYPGQRLLLVQRALGLQR